MSVAEDKAIEFQNIYNDMKKFLIKMNVTDEKIVKEKIIEFLKKTCYSENEKGKKKGILQEIGFNDSLIERYNSTFKDDKKRDFFAKELVTSFENPFKLKDLSGEFSDKMLQSMSKIELIAKAMQWCNRIAKAFEAEIEKYRRESIRTGIYEDSVHPKLLNRDLTDFTLMYPDYVGMSDNEIQEDLGKEAFDKYIEDRKEVEKALKEAGIKPKPETICNYLRFASMLDAKEYAYYLKDRFENKCMLEIIEKDFGSKVVHYINVDKNKSNKDQYRFVYCVAIDGYTDPYEVHMSKDNIDGTLKMASDKLKKKVTIKVVPSNDRFKTEIPRKITDNLREDLNKVYANPKNPMAGKISFQSMDLINYAKSNVKKATEEYSIDGISKITTLGGDEDAR